MPKIRAIYSLQSVPANRKTSNVSTLFVQFQGFQPEKLRVIETTSVPHWKYVILIIPKEPGHAAVALENIYIYKEQGPFYQLNHTQTQTKITSALNI